MQPIPSGAPQPWLPLRDLQGRTVAALNVVTSPQRLQAAQLENDLLPMLRDAARELRPLL